ncbi:MAG: TrkH family potassium uptake protein [Planctomycetota bacterium]|nr:TrkH family potassium uptake protein [Planctomycetota bacterium]
MNLRAVLGVLGHILRPFALLLVVPAAVDLGYGDTRRASAFALTSAVAFAIGAGLARLTRGQPRTSRTDSIGVVAGTWVLAALFGALPYMDQGFSPINALFESMSGFTTTGATIFTDEWSYFVDGNWTGPLSPGLIVWRCMTQWLGGMGIIVLFVAVLPALAVSGRQMFFAEAPGPTDEALTPRIRNTAVALWKVYIGLTAIEVILLRTVGDMLWYDAVCHGFTTIAAGGFSPHPDSIAAYGPTVQWIILPFMFLAGTSFALQYRALFRPGALFRDREFRAYVLIVVAAGAGVTLLLYGRAGGGEDATDSLRHGLFQTVSILTTTGYASENFGNPKLWNDAPLMILFALMFIGGSAGSAGGGPKVIRIMLLARFLTREVLTALHPRAVWTIKIGGQHVQRETMRQVLGFLLAYITFFGVVALAVGIAENDFRVGLTGSIVTLGNIGPGFGAIGPMGTFGELTVFSKILLIINMWVGRLEVMTVLMIFHGSVLRSLTWRK